MNELTSSQPLVIGSPLASRVAPGAERGPMPYLFFSGVLSPLGSLDVRARADYFAHAGRQEYEDSRKAIGAIGESISQNTFLAPGQKHSNCACNCLPSACRAWTKSSRPRHNARSAFVRSLSGTSTRNR